MGACTGGGDGDLTPLRLEREWTPKRLQELWRQRNTRREDVNRTFFQEYFPDHWRLLPLDTQQTIARIRERVTALGRRVRVRRLQRVLDLPKVLVTLIVAYE